jgi:hypothetical protein
MFLRNTFSFKSLCYYLSVSVSMIMRIIMVVVIIVILHFPEESVWIAYASSFQLLNSGITVRPPNILKNKRRFPFILMLVTLRYTTCIDYFISKSMKTCSCSEYRNLVNAYLMELTYSSFKYRLLKSLSL